jgi:hypothetical protein
MHDPTVLQRMLSQKNGSALFSREVSSFSLNSGKIGRHLFVLCELIPILASHAALVTAAALASMQLLLLSHSTL